EFLGTEDTILFSSCFDANGGVFESLFGPEDAVISDALNHASIIDGIRLSKAKRFRYANQDMDDLRGKLTEAATMNDGAGPRRSVIVTDGVFSMDGFLAPLQEICDLADEFGALVMVDDSHAVGFMGATGAGTPEHAGVSERVDIYTGTFGKALGGASGGYVAGRSEIVAMLRQKARPYLFSNSLAPAIVAATLKALELVVDSGELRTRLFENAALFRRRMTEEGFELLDGEHAIIPVMFGDAAKAAAVADTMLEHGVYVTAFSFPVVPRDAARIRVQLSAAHSPEDIEACVQAFISAR
ncbi:MAG: glycine C-acetyltransferase, partial [Arthrobacter sp.]